MGETKKKTRRGPGEGTIYKNKRGMWVAQLVVGRDPRTGKPGRMTYYGKTMGEVRDKLVEAKYQLKQNELVRPSSETLGDWIVEWLEDYTKNSVERTTFESYSSWVYKHIIPGLGEIPLQKLHGSKIQRFINDKCCDLSSTSVRHICRILRASLEEAVEQGKLNKHVMERVKRPKKEEYRIDPWEIDEKNQFLSKIREDRLYPFFLLALESGMRRGELLGLQWRDLDSRNNKITISRSYNVVKGGAKFGKPKAGSGRTITLPEKVTDELLAWKAIQAKEKEFLGKGYKDQGMIFTTSIGTPIYPREVNRHFERLIELAGGRKIRFHDLRHTHATVLLALGVHPKVVQLRLGHKSIKVTLDLYSHKVDRLDEEAAQKLGNNLDEVYAAEIID
jgi:integrase